MNDGRQNGHQREPAPERELAPAKVKQAQIAVGEHPVCQDLIGGDDRHGQVIKDPGTNQPRKEAADQIGQKDIGIEGRQMRPVRTIIRKQRPEIVVEIPCRPDEFRRQASGGIILKIGTKYQVPQIEADRSDYRKRDRVLPRKVSGCVRALC